MSVRSVPEDAMHLIDPPSSDVAFTPAVKAIQARKGLRPVHRSFEERGGFPTRITPDLAAFIAAQTSVFLATASRESQPYYSTAAGRRASCTCSTSARWRSPISPATGNTSRSAISRKIPRRICF